MTKCNCVPTIPSCTITWIKSESEVEVRPGQANLFGFIFYLRAGKIKEGNELTGTGHGCDEIGHESER